MAIMSFCRYEKKFLVSAETAKRFAEKISDHVSLDPYCIGGKEYSISNIYYDTDQHTVISHSLSKPKYKEKPFIKVQLQDEKGLCCGSSLFYKYLQDNNLL